MPWATNSARPEHVEAEFPDGITVEQARCVLETGDIILFQGRYLVSSAYRWARGGDYYSHAAIVAERDHDTMPDDIMRSGWLQRMGPIWLD